MNIQQLFALGMKREIPQLIPMGRPVINLGAGNDTDTGIPLDRPDWNAGNRMPFVDNTIDTFLAFHFFEHLHKDELIATLLECQRCLRVGGTINIVVPYYKSELAFQDLDHKQFFTETTWKMLFQNDYYSPFGIKEWRFNVYANYIIGIVGRNLCLTTQLVKF